MKTPITNKMKRPGSFKRPKSGTSGEVNARKRRDTGKRERCALRNAKNQLNIGCSQSALKRLPVDPHVAQRRKKAKAKLWHIPQNPIPKYLKFLE